MRRDGAGSVQQFPYRLRDLEEATNNFSDKNKLGSGGSADVYKGTINDTIVAIKKLHGNSVEQQVDVDKEVHMLGSLEHENIVKLLGFCSEDGQYLLVYEYVQNGNLASYLNDENKRKNLNWGMRFNIINGIARGLFYLHHDSKDSVIHRDLKPENVLLDENHNAKIADFGISKILDKNKTHNTTTNGRGTRGYLAPELWYLQHYSPKSDIYNFGLLILEIIVGCTIPRYSKRNGQVLSHVVWHQWKNDNPLIDVTDMFVREELADMVVIEELSRDQIKRCILIGLICIQNDHNKRPGMKHVLQMLNTNILLPAPGLPGFLHEETSRTSLSSISSSFLETDLLPTPRIEGGVLSSPKQTDTLPTPQIEGEVLSSPKLKKFSFNDLRIATKNFHPANNIGKSGLRSVYKGRLDEQTLAPCEPFSIFKKIRGQAPSKPGTGMVVAVKSFRPRFPGHEKWQTEVDYLGQLHHPNLIKLIGHCSEGDERLLVYEFMPRSSLDKHIFSRDAQPLPWEIRLKVAIGAAKALSFLHDAESQVIHRNFKAANILLDSDYNAKLADFGFAKAGPKGDETHVSTRVLGTHGYAAPEYIATGRISAKADVYSFGVVLLELLTGRRVFDKTRIGIKQNLVDWAKPSLCDKRKLYRIMDSRLEGQYPRKKAQVVSNLALLCISNEARLRPKMSEVLKILEQLKDPKDNDELNHENSTIGRRLNCF
ncbi:Protein kinase superfamily protein [Rhynchospora pubera]|uniref:Protein kinase superfamily protein n=1 Tax=Rhynchospora pubera TaxID=906938 RepID=A0AAV8HRQ4_9POAL|nr:Protein kinase superfamily protein [Rhynchospora pubera]